MPARQSSLWKTDWRQQSRQERGPSLVVCGGHVVRPKGAGPVCQ